jgi:predicted phosphodiesterase
LIKKTERKVPLRQYLLNLRKEDVVFKDAFTNRLDKVSIKSIMSDEFIEHCTELLLSNRDIATILNCSYGTIGQYRGAYNRLKYDDILFEKVDYKEDIINYEPINSGWFELTEQEHLFLMVSDIQAGSLVTAKGRDVNPERTVEIYFELLIDRLVEKLSKRKIKVKNFHLMLLGDLVDGWKKFPNQQTVPLRDQKKVLVKGLLKLIKSISELVEPEQLNVYGVFGNHGTIDRYYPTTDNWDLIVMEELMVHIDLLKNFDDAFKCVNNLISEEETQVHQIGEFKYFILHGHQMKGFSYESWKKGMDEFYVSKGGFDCMLMGHWHVVNQLSNKGKTILVNGCTYVSEYVANKLHGKEDIAQVLFASDEYEPVAWMEKLNVDQGIIT